jgi:hypothetical protein
MALQRMESLLGCDELQPLASAARRIRRLNRLYRAAAPRELAAASGVKTCKAGTLVVIADNAAVAAKLRQMTAGLLAEIRKSAADVSAVRIEVGVGAGTGGSTAPPAKALLSRDTVTKFAELGKRLPAGGLKTAIGDLVKHHSPRKKLS